MNNDREFHNKLKKYVFIQDERLYKYDTETVVYKSMPLNKNNNMILSIVTSFLSKSKKTSTKNNQKYCHWNIKKSLKN